MYQISLTAILLLFIVIFYIKLVTNCFTRSRENIKFPDCVVLHLVEISNLLDRRWIYRINSTCPGQFNYFFCIQIILSEQSPRWIWIICVPTLNAEQHNILIRFRGRRHVHYGIMTILAVTLLSAFISVGWPHWTERHRRYYLNARGNGLVDKCQWFRIGRRRHSFCVYFGSGVFFLFFYFFFTSHTPGAKVARPRTMFRKSARLIFVPRWRVFRDKSPAERYKTYGYNYIPDTELL